MTGPLMPKATAVWLVENTSLTFEQIAQFCGLHPLEVKGIADGDVAQGIKGRDPVAHGELTRDEIEKGEADARHRMKPAEVSGTMVETQPRRGPRYTPVSRRQDRPNAIAWLVRNHPELTDGQIGKLVGTTKQTIQAIRERTHWNMANIKPVDPVTVGLSSQIELDNAVQKAARRVARAEARSSATKVGTLKPASQTVVAAPAPEAQPEPQSVPELEPEPAPEPEPEPAPAPEPEPAESEAELDPERVFRSPPNES